MSFVPRLQEVPKLALPFGGGGGSGVCRGGFVIDPKIPCVLVLLLGVGACDCDGPRSAPTVAPQPSAPAAKPGSTAASAIARFGLSVDALRAELAEKAAIHRERSPDWKPSGSNPAPILLANMVRTRLLNAVRPSPLRILVSTRESHVTLTGHVDTVERLQKAILAVLSVVDVRAVTSKVKVSPD